MASIYTREAMQARLDSLRAEREAIRAVAQPMRDKRDAILAEIQPKVDEAKALAKSYREAEIPAYEIEREIGLLARALGGRVAGATAAAPAQPVGDAPTGD